MNKLAYWYLISYTSLTVFAHFLGASGIKSFEYSRNFHLASLIINFILLVGLFCRDRWSYRLGIIVYGIYVLSYPFDAYEKYMKDDDFDFYWLCDWFAQIAALVIVSLLAVGKLTIHKKSSTMQYLR